MESRSSRKAEMYSRRDNCLRLISSLKRSALRADKRVKKASLRELFAQCVQSVDEFKKYTELILREEILAPAGAMIPRIPKKSQNKPLGEGLEDWVPPPVEHLTKEKGSGEGTAKKKKEPKKDFYEEIVRSCSILEKNVREQTLIVLDSYVAFSALVETVATDHSTFGTM